MGNNINIEKLGELPIDEYMATKAYARSKPVYFLSKIDVASLQRTPKKVHNPFVLNEEPVNPVKCSLDEVQIGDTLSFVCSLKKPDGSDVGNGRVTVNDISDYLVDTSKGTFLLDSKEMIITTFPMQWPLYAIEQISKQFPEFNKNELFNLTDASWAEFSEALEEKKRETERENEELSRDIFNSF